MNTVPCSDDCLRALLESKSDADQDLHDVTKHVESCEVCQRRLLELAADEDDWHLAKESLSESQLDAEITREQTVRPWTTLYGAEAANRWTESLVQHLLDPPSHPEMLGRLGRYEIEQCIGSGGMGVVFKAFDTELNRPVAIKVLAPPFAGVGAARQRFAREARAAAAIVHEHVVAIHNVEPDSDPPFLVMPFVAGESLQDRINREGALGLREILRIAKQTAEALAAAHQQGLVHRDVKPSNILLEQGVERALLTDFGLARTTDDATLTRSGHLAGTPHYMSPEQAKGESTDQQSDLFSLGCVLYAMATGRPPFRAETTYGVLRKITDSTPHSIRDLNPEIPAWLEALIGKLLAKSAEDRFPSAAVLAETLEQCLAHVQQPQRQPLPQRVTALLPAENHRAKSTVLAVAGMAVALVALWIMGPTQRKSPTVNTRNQSESPQSGAETDEATAANQDWEEADLQVRSLMEEIEQLSSETELFWDDP